MNGKRERILALDLLRGLFLLVIIVDHLSLFPNLFEIFSGRGHLWSSAAEGFFLISGTLVGYIYGPRMSVAPARTTIKIWKRALELYCYSVTTSFVFLWWGNHVSQGAKPGLWVHPPIREMVEKVLTLRYVYGWTDFLTHYVVYMLVAPLAVYLLSRRKSWLLVVGSLAVWSHRGAYMDKAWQLLFMAGILLGYYLPYLETKAKLMSVLRQKTMTWTIYGFAGLVYIASGVAIRIPEYVSDNNLTSGRLYDFSQPLIRFHDRTLVLFDKNTLGSGRVLVSFLWFTALYIVFRRNETRIHRWSKGVLEAFGKVSLYVYVVHAFVLFALHLVLPVNMGFIANTIVTAWSAAIVYECIQYRDKIVHYWRKKPLQRRIMRERMPQNSSLLYLAVGQE